MINQVFINNIGVFLPNNPVSNDDMEKHLGLISGKPSRVKSIVLRQNGIKRRFYALDQQQNITHTSAEMAVEAIKRLFSSDFSGKNIDLLACATSIPDQLLPSHASMVHGLLKNKPTEIYSSAGVCLTCLQALKIGYMSIKAENSQNAVCCASELVSATLLSKNYEEEYEKAKNVGENPYMAFEKDFLRFMLSDGAGAVLLENAPKGNQSLKLEWIEMTSYANELPTCMFLGAELENDGELKSWKKFKSQELIDRSVFAVKQDIRLLKVHIIKYWVDHIESCLKKHNISAPEVDYVIPHVSSMFFYHKLLEEICARNIDLREEKWFTNLTSVGNIGSAAVFVALEELFHSGKLKKGQKILLLVPESGRFSYGTALLTVC
jgi:3-oxoacyl-[acyl-carrier-protein] synthase III